MSKLCLIRKDKDTALFSSLKNQPGLKAEHEAADKLSRKNNAHTLSVVVNLLSNYYSGGLNRTLNLFTRVALTISFIPDGLLTPTFHYKKPLPLLRHTRMHKLTLQRSLVRVWNSERLLQLCGFTQTFLFAFHQCFVATTSDPVNVLSANTRIQKAHYCSCKAKGNGIRKSYWNAQTDESLLQVSGANSSNGHIQKSCHLIWSTLWILCNDAFHCDILCKHCFEVNAFLASWQSLLSSCTK